MSTRWSKGSESYTGESGQCGPVFRVKLHLLFRVFAFLQNQTLDGRQNGEGVQNSRLSALTVAGSAAPGRLCGWHPCTLHPPGRACGRGWAPSSGGPKTQAAGGAQKRCHTPRECGL